MTVDIHNYTRRLETAERSVQKSKLSKQNKDIIFKFENHLFATGISKPRILKYLDSLKLLGLWLEKDFEKVSKDDIMALVMKIRKRDDYSPWTKQSYCVIIKRFYKWLLGDDKEYPKEVSWIPTNLNKSKLKLPGEGDLLTEDEIKRVLDVTTHPRNKALIAILFESGCRIGEIASLRMKHVQVDEHGVLLTVFGKTGSRKIRVISSTPYVMGWLQIHPLVKDKEAPLWLYVNIGKKSRDSHLTYQGISKIIKESFKDAGIHKRIYPHLFRHSRATILASHLTEFQMNQYFGWVQGSDMPSTYVHLSGRDLDAALMKFNGMSAEEVKQKESRLKPKICPRCDTINEHDSDYCKKCTAILDEKLKIELEQRRNVRANMDKMMDLLMKDGDFRKIVVERMKCIQ